MVCYRAGGETGAMDLEERRDKNTVRFPTDSQGVPSGTGEWDRVMIWGMKGWRGRSV